MKKSIIAAVALSFAGAFAAVAASAAPSHHGPKVERHIGKPQVRSHRHRCHFEKKRIRHHGKWTVRTVKVCR
ncbi:hypothetical protein NJB93_19115 [Brucella intermedia]|uniref:hypothetical protein n=1 Tax=Brucella intermedia TaxID=94625 RepID=UPI0013AEC8A5|nr:hypothetical protein [Brucella intermedia]MCO7728698.1 hypothetical protein [Brucella intermedia]